MFNLLRASFIKLKREKFFYIILGAILVINLIIVIFAKFGTVGYIVGNGGETETVKMFQHADDLLYSGLSIMSVGIYIAIFISMFTGNEYNYGTMKNKITVGKSRSQIYLSELLINVITSTIFFIAQVGVILLLSCPILGWSVPFTSSEFVKVLGVIVLMYLLFITLTALFTFMTIILKNGRLCFILNILFLFIGIYATTAIYSLSSSWGNFGIVLKGVVDMILFGQANLVLAETGITIMLAIKVVVSSIITTGIVTFGGILIFDRLDLK